MARLIGTGGTRSRLSIVWHDTAAGALAAQGMTLAERRLGRVTSWRLERIGMAGAGPEVVAESATVEGLEGVPGATVPIAGFLGTWRATLGEDGVSAWLLQGVLQAAAATAPVCRVVLSGPAAAVGTMAMRLAEAEPVARPARSLAGEGYAVAGRMLPPGGNQRFQAGWSADAACRRAAGFLVEAMHRELRRAGVQANEPVHQARVALRRLRAVLAVFGGAEAGRLRPGLRELGAVLGPARDWDVFCGSTLRRAAAMFEGDPALVRLGKAGERRRVAAYAPLRAYLAGDGFRRLGVALAAFCVGSGPAGGDDPRLPAIRLHDLASRALSRRLGRLMKAGDHIGDLPEPALHAIRLQAKRLRYGAELFAPLFSQRSTTKFLRRLSRLQEQLGLLNDGAVAAGLMRELGAPGRGFGAGLVQGAISARAAGARAEIARSWRKLRRAERFWT